MKAFARKITDEEFGLVTEMQVPKAKEITETAVEGKKTSKRKKNTSVADPVIKNRVKELLSTHNNYLHGEVDEVVSVFFASIVYIINSH